MALQEVINESWKIAFKARDEIRRSTYELLKQRFLVAEKSGKYNLPLSDEVIQDLIAKEYKERAGILEAYKPTDDTYILTKQQMEVLEMYLPRQMSEEEVIDIIKRLAENETNPGKLIGLTVKEVGNKFDKSKIAGLVKQICQR